MPQLRPSYASSARATMHAAYMPAVWNQNGEGMRIAFPTLGNEGLDDTIGEHFGKVPTYTIVDTETHEVKVVENASIHGGGEIYPPELLSREKVDVLICSGIGRKALSMFQGFKIKVYMAGVKKVADALQDFINGELKEACIEDGCVE